jgi:hypothetical protein
MVGSDMYGHRYLATEVKRTMKLLAQAGKQQRSLYDYIASSNKVRGRPYGTRWHTGERYLRSRREVGRRGRKEFEERAVANVKNKLKREATVADARALSKNSFGSSYIVKEVVDLEMATKCLSLKRFVLRSMVSAAKHSCYLSRSVI